MGSIKARFLFVCLALALSLSVLTPIRTQKAATYWDIYPGFNFYAVDGGGPINFNTPVTASGWYFIPGYVIFQQLKTTDFTWSEIGFNCSSNAEMRIEHLGEKIVQYNVTAATGQNSTTKVRFGADVSVYRVDNADAWSYLNRVLTVTVTHSSPAYIVIYYTAPWGAVADLVNSAFENFGIVGYVTSISAYITGLTTYFYQSLTGILQLVVQQFRFINLAFNSLLYWFTAFLGIIIDFVEFWQDLMNGVNVFFMDLGNLWDWIGWNTWAPALPLFLFLSWLFSLERRAQVTPGGEMQVLVNDFNTAANLISYFLGVFSFVANTIIDRVYGFIEWLG